MEASDASVNRMPCQSVGADRHAVPDDEADAGNAEQKSHRPCARSAPHREKAAPPATAVNTGLALTIKPPRPAETVCSPV